jgi:hypothetical protein
MSNLILRAYDTKLSKYVDTGEITFHFYGDTRTTVTPNEMHYGEIKEYEHDVLNGRFIVEKGLGIKDMAGNEVFEGDILKEESGSKTRISDGKKFPQYSSETIEILFKDGNFKERVIAHENSYFGKIPSKPVDIKSWMITKAFKIIGNIHTPTNA